MIHNENCLPDDAWSKMHPLGMQVELVQRNVLQGEEFEEIVLRLSHNRAGKFTDIRFTIPKFNANIIKWRNSKKALMYLATILIDSEFDIAMFEKDESERMDIEITSPNQVAIQRIEEAITHGLRNWFYNTEPDFSDHSIQNQIDQWISNGEEWRVLKISPIAQEDQHNGVIFKTKIPVQSHIERLLVKIFNPKLWDLLDLNSTSFSDKANESFRFVVGVKMQNGQLMKADNSEAPICQILKKHAIFLENNPRRAYLLRNTFEQALDIINSELPIVTPYEVDEDNVLNGANLITAIMHIDHHTHEDSIAISESAAKKLRAARTITQLIESNRVITPKIAKGEAVSPDTVIAIDGDNEVTASKLYMPGIVEELVISKGKRFGIQTNRLWFKFTSFYNLESGDKLSNRHGGKGICKVLPDELFPISADGTRVEVAIGPETIINRKALSIFKEMMLTKYCAENNLSSIKVNGGFNHDVKYECFSDSSDGNSFKVDAFDFNTLAQKYGSKDQLYIDGVSLPEATYVSKLFWIRLDKIAKEIISSVNTRRRKSSFGGVIDKAKLSGQRCNIAKILALTGRGADQIAQEIIVKNSSGHEFFTELVKAVQNKKFISK